MKNLLRRLFAPLLKGLESGDQAYVYKRSHRLILGFMSSVFTALGVAGFFVSRGEESTYLFPVLIFGGLGVYGLIICLLGSDRAVAKILNSRR
ncbi:MAG: hypothetical protein V7711_09790 [Pseudomonadales bacterium]